MTIKIDAEPKELAEFVTELANNTLLDKIAKQLAEHFGKEPPPNEPAKAFGETFVTLQDLGLAQ